MSLLEPISIKYEGGLADENKMPLCQLSRVAHGLDEILGVSAEFAISHRVIRHRPSRKIAVVVQAPQHGSFELLPLIDTLSQHPLALSLVSGLFPTLIALIFSHLSRKNEVQQLQLQIKDLMAVLGKEKDYNIKLAAQFFDAIDKLRSPAIKAVSPVGQGCNLMTVSYQNKPIVSIGPKDREIIELGPDTDIRDASTYHVTFSELDRMTGGCRVSFQNAPAPRIRGAVLDDKVHTDSNKYAVAFAQGINLTVTASEVWQGNELKKLLIHNAL